MSTFKVGVDELSKVVINGYKELLEQALRKEIIAYLNPIVDEAVKDLADRIRLSVNSWRDYGDDKVVVELYIDKSKVDY